MTRSISSASILKFNAFPYRKCISNARLWGKALFICSLLWTFTINAQNNPQRYLFEYIATNNGLPHDYVTSIISDNLNAKWIGTENGLTKYNGFNFENIKPGKSYKKLKNENIEVLFKDRDIIWIGTKSGGISSLDIKTNTLKNYNHLLKTKKNIAINITAIAADDRGNIWIGTWEDGVFVINPSENKLIKYIAIKSVINSIVKDNKSNMWFTYYQSLVRFNMGFVRTNFKLKTNLSDVIVDSKRNRLWIGTSNINSKLYYFDFNSQLLDSLETGIFSDYYKTLSLDSQNRLWIGTWGKGLYRSNLDVTKFSKIALVAPNSFKNSNNYNTILKVHHDKNNQVWVATANGGIVKLIEDKGFTNATEILNTKSLNGDLNFPAICKTKSRLFVGTLNNGLFAGTSFANLKPISEIGRTKIIALYEHENKLYIGTKASFYIYDIQLNKIIFTHKKINKATSFLIDKTGILYIGTQQNGIAIVPLSNINNDNAYRYYSDLKQGNFKVESNRITSILQDSKGNIWVGTYNGIHLYDRAKKTFKAKSLSINDKLPSVIINSMAIIKDNIWLGTPSGLLKLTYNGNKVEIKNQLTMENGLKSDFICSVAYDNHFNIWFSTKTEIVKYVEKNNSFTSFGEDDGLKTTSFNNRSFSNFENEILFFGGIDNITFFNPNKIAKNYVVPEIIYTSLRVNNNFVQYPSEQNQHRILDKNFSYVKKIQLTHNDNFFSIGFITNNFSGKSNIKYRYKLQGYHDSWVNLQNQNEINFAGIVSGNYVLNVAASTDGQNWSKSKNLEIEILESPWKSVWAVLSYVILTFLLLLYIAIFYNEKLKLKNSLVIAKNDREREIELSELKLNFFTNISHEFRTPLTLIIAPLNEMLKNSDLSPKVLKKLNLIDRNANRLLNLITQLLDFRKAEYGLLQLSVSNGNIVRFSKEVFLYFNEIAKAKDIKYKFKNSEDDINFPFDRNKIEIVLCNLLSNAFKYCNEGDKIKVYISKEDDFCVISVTDTGVGMEEDYLSKIFDHFYQIKSAESTKIIGSGIGLSFSKKIIELHHGTIEVKSQKNIGTEFIIKLPLLLTYNENEIDYNFINTDNIKAYENHWDENPVENLSIKNKENTILIIDDNQDILNYLKDILAETYNIFVANNGIDGFNLASDEIPDLILSDVMMPGKDGITLCNELKSQITTSHIPIILLTARTSTVFEIQGLETGADDYVTKPFNPTIIRARIASQLDNRKRLRSVLLNKVQFEPTTVVPEPNINIESAFIQKAILLVENNLQNINFSIEFMVEELNMSQSTLYRKIKSLTGLSLTSFIRSIRLKKAAHLILTGDLNLSQVAYEVGFNDYKYFKLSFEKQFNSLPSKYKESMVKKNS